MWQAVYQVQTKITILGRDPWEWVTILGLTFIALKTSQEWAGAVGALIVAVLTFAISSLILRLVKQRIAVENLIDYLEWLFLTADVYVVERERLCKPLVLR
jgi:uncharacterized membrane protein